MRRDAQELLHTPLAVDVDAVDANADRCIANNINSSVNLSWTHICLYLKPGW